MTITPKSILAACAAFAFSSFFALEIAHAQDATGVEEHMLRAAQADALGAEIARSLSVIRRFGVGAHFHAARLFGPFHDLFEIISDDDGRVRKVLSLHRLCPGFRRGMVVHGRVRILQASS